MSDTTEGTPGQNSEPVSLEGGTDPVSTPEHSPEGADRAEVDGSRPNENEAGFRCSNHDRARGTPCDDVFSQAIDVACSARVARDQAIEASQRADYIQELSARARCEADALHTVSAGLAATATSVAMVALEVCHRSNMEDAFMSNPVNSQRISYEDFCDVLQAGYRQSRSPSPSNSRPPSLSRPSPTRGIIPIVPAGPGLDALGLRSQGLQGVTRNDSVGQEVPIPSTRQRRYSSPPIVQPSLPSSGTWLLSSPSDVDSGHMLRKEKFPCALSADVYKESLAATFDSKSCITPLWEDRYCDPAVATQPSNPQLSSERWKDKKAMRQFQIRLQKMGMESESSEESVSTDRSRGRATDVTSGRQQTRVKGYRAADRPGYLTRTVSTSDSDENLSSDSEIEQILMDVKTPKQLHKLKDLEERAIRGCHLAANTRNTKVRAISPLLSTSEKDFYTVSGEESCPSPTVQKHVFVVPGTVRSFPNNDTSLSDVTAGLDDDD